MPFILPVPPALSINCPNASYSSSINVSTSLCFFVEISLENKTFPSLSTIPNFVPVPPISTPITNGSSKDDEAEVAIIIFLITHYLKNYVLHNWFVKHKRFNGRRPQRRYHSLYPALIKYFLRQNQRRQDIQSIQPL